jgi:hypothetical protein
MAAIPYGFALTIGCLLLAGVYALDRDASLTGRVAVIVLTGLSFYLPGGFWWHVLAVVLQLGVCLFVLLRARLRA